MKPALSLPLEGGRLLLTPIHERAVRVQYRPEGAGAPVPTVTLVSPRRPPCVKSDSRGKITLSTACMQAVFHKADGSLEFRDAAGRTVLREVPGRRKVSPGNVRGNQCFAVEQAFVSPLNERLHGLGQFQDGHSDLRGVTRRLLQMNSQISIPFVLSSEGYGLLWHQQGLTEFNPADEAVTLEQDPEEGPEFSIHVTGSTGGFTETCRVRTYRGEVNLPADGDYTFFLDYGGMTTRHELEIDGHRVMHQENYWLPPSASIRLHLGAGRHTVRITATKGEPVLSWRACDATTVFRSPHAQDIDYVVFVGPELPDVLSSLRSVSGGTPLLPRWAYGFWQCRERYETQTQLLENAREHRARRLPVDVMVQDWQYWPSTQWAGMQFDPERYPDPTAMVEELKRMDLRLVVSVWENISRNSDLGAACEATGQYLPDSQWIDMTSPDNRKAHWEAMRTRLKVHGVAGWWMDATEPENDALAGVDTFLGPGEFHRLTYPLRVSQAVFEGERESSPETRPCILTRCAFPGQQRFNSITWSGDIGSDWDAFRRQIVAGLNYCASGLPYWTTDIGGFFRPPGQHEDPGYHEILTRWLQFGAFNPVMRLHGFGTETELWRFGAVVEKNARAILELRYRLLPYLYSEAWAVSSRGASMMRPVMVDFPADADAGAHPFQYLFGTAFLVAPVTEPGDSVAVALPGGTSWWNFWTGEFFQGGQTLEVAAPREQIPLFVRAGGIVPMGSVVQHSGEDPHGALTICVYGGADGAFTLYDDAGDGFGYERGERALVELSWNDAAGTLTFGDLKGTFPGMPARRMFHIVLTVPGSAPRRADVTYEGKALVLALS